MPSVTIVKGFTLTHDKTTTDDPLLYSKNEFIAPGTYDMSDALANHWFVKAHSDNPPVPNYPAGTPEYAAAMAAANKRTMLLQLAQEQQRADAAAQVKAQQVEETPTLEQAVHDEAAAIERKPVPTRRPPA